MLLRGVAGVGKTALLDHSVDSAADLVVLRATGIPGEAEVAFAGLLEVLRPLLHRLPELPFPQRDVLAGALGLAPATERDRFLTGAATLALLLAGAADRPVLVCVDDAHWLDTPSLEALLFAGRRLAGAPAGMILTARDEPHLALDTARLEVVPVPALDREATNALAATLTGRSPDKGAEEIFRRTQGLPLAVAEWSRLVESDMPWHRFRSRASWNAPTCARQSRRPRRSGYCCSSRRPTIQARSRRSALPPSVSVFRSLPRSRRSCSGSSKWRKAPFVFAILGPLCGLPVGAAPAQAARARGARRLPHRRVAGRPPCVAPGC